MIIGNPLPGTSSTAIGPYPNATVLIDRVIIVPHDNLMALHIENERLFIAKISTLNLSTTQMHESSAADVGTGPIAVDPHADSSENFNYSNRKDHPTDKIPDDAASKEVHREMASLDALPLEVIALSDFS